MAQTFGSGHWTCVGCIQIFICMTLLKLILLRAEMYGEKNFPSLRENMVIVQSYYNITLGLSIVGNMVIPITPECGSHCGYGSLWTQLALGVNIWRMKRGWLFVWRGLVNPVDFILLGGGACTYHSQSCIEYFESREIMRTKTCTCHSWKCTYSNLIVRIQFLPRWLSNHRDC